MVNSTSSPRSTLSPSRTSVKWKKISRTTSDLKENQFQLLQCNLTFSNLKCLFKTVNDWIKVIKKWCKWLYLSMNPNFPSSLMELTTPWYLTGLAGFSNLIARATNVPLRCMVAIWKLTLSPEAKVTLPSTSKEANRNLIFFQASFTERFHWLIVIKFFN